MNRFVLRNKSIRNNKIVFSPEQSRKIYKVLRLKQGDKVQVIDNKGYLYTVTLIKLFKEEVVGQIVEKELYTPKNNSISLFQAVPKHIKVKFILQKCTELGVDKFVFWTSQFSQVKLNKASSERLERWRKIVQNASEQSNRIFVPEVLIDNRNLIEILSELQRKNYLIFLLDIDGLPLNQLKDEIKTDLKNKNIAVFVGSEGGFSNIELDYLNKANAIKIKVAYHNLRSETAGMAFLAQLFLMG